MNRGVRVSSVQGCALLLCILTGVNTMAHSVETSLTGVSAEPGSDASTVGLTQHSSTWKSASESERPSRYLPVQTRRGQHRLPSLASEEALPAETPEAVARPAEYVPAAPLGVWRETPPIPRQPASPRSQ